MATPTVTITVGGVPVTATRGGVPAEDVPGEDALYMLYVQAVKGEQRKQWLVFPPALESLGVKSARVKSDKTLLMLARIQTEPGNRSKWFQHTIITDGEGNNTLRNTLNNLIQSEGWEVGFALAIPCELDDYLKAWNDQATPHKAMRAVDRALRPYGQTVK